MVKATADKVAIPPMHFRIGDIVRYTGLSRQTIHNYTTMGLIREVDRTPGGHRLYDESVFYRLHRIAQLKESRSMDEIVRVLGRQESD
ncbi:MAG: MerR family DNA-binding transcriptional regulator [Phycisphaera sp.]|nr:MerR family DNA-binding transcriptional regulator [Phycisphaera sp.]